MPNAVVNVERNGGFGASVLAKLINSDIKRNLYFEIKDKVIEEQNDGTKVIKRTQKTKVYGLDSTKSKRELLIQILRERVDNHKDKFISKRIYDELVGMEVKRNGKVEHSSNSHDDLVFAYLMAMYVWYEGKDLKEHFNILKTTIKTDEDIDEVMYGLEEKFSDITEEIRESYSPDNKEYNDELKAMAKAQGILYSKFIEQELAKDNASLAKLLATRKDARQAYGNMYNIPQEELEYQYGSRGLDNQAFLNYLKDDDLNILDPNDVMKNPNNKLPPNWKSL